jgi:hypothetical protein
VRFNKQRNFANWQRLIVLLRVAASQGAMLHSDMSACDKRGESLLAQDPPSICLIRLSSTAQ